MAQAAVSRAKRLPIPAQGVWAPIWLLEAYLALTVAIFFLGPVKWDLPNAPTLVTFLVVNYGALWLGYAWGVRRGQRHLRHATSWSPGIHVKPWIVRLCLLSIVFTIITTTTRLVAIRGGLGPALDTFANPGEAYLQAQLIAEMDRQGEPIPIESFSWAFRASTVFAVLNSLYFTVGIACWRHLSSLMRVMFVMALVASILFTVGMGAQMGIGMLVFSLLPIALYRRYVVLRTDRKARRQGRRASIVAAAAVLTLAATVVFFQVDRAESTGMLETDTILVSSYGTATEVVAIFDDPRINYGVAMLCKYVSHGYQGLALSMELPFEWTFGLGWSKALQVIVKDYLAGPDLFPQTYLARNEVLNGWPALQWWSTIFPWIASDTTYFGTLAALLLAGFIIGRVWMSVVITGNPIGFTMLAQMFILVFMFPANNALAQTLEGLFGFLGITLIYLLSQTRYHVQGTPRASPKRDGTSRQTGPAAPSGMPPLAPASVLCIGNGGVVRGKGGVLLTHQYARDFLADLSPKMRRVCFCNWVVPEDALAVHPFHDIPRVQPLGLAPIHGHAIRKAVNGAIAAARLAGEIIRADVVYLFWPGGIAAGAALICRVIGKPYGIYLRGEVEPNRHRATFSRARFVLTTGQVLNDYVSRYCADVENVTPMIAIRKEHVAPPRVLQTDGPWNLLYVGRIEEQKGVHELLTAVARLVDDGMPVNLTLVGHCTATEPLLSLLPAAVRERVRLAGPVAEFDRLAQIYRSADIFVLPTRNEGFPRVLYEAMAFGLPILTTFVGSISSVLKDEVNCLRLEVDDPRDIAAKTQRLLTDRELYRRLSVEGNATIINQFASWRRSHAEQVAERIRDIVLRVRPAPTAARHRALPHA